MDPLGIGDAKLSHLLLIGLIGNPYNGGIVLYFINPYRMGLLTIYICLDSIVRIVVGAKNGRFVQNPTPRATRSKEALQQRGILP